MARETSPESPAPVRSISGDIAEWISRLGAVWVDGQIAQISRRPGMRMAWITLRDVDVEMSLSVVVDVSVLDSMPEAAVEGQRVLVHAKPEFYTGRGSLQLRAREIRPVGRGALLEEIERLRALFAAEGLFAAERKRPLPFLPRRIGLVSGRASAAMKDVLVNARLRWPAVEFEVREVAVQGVAAVNEIVTAITDLNADPLVDVIVIARGGGSVEDLLPFSNETLVRAVARSRVPVVSAIGHEQDVPLLDLVADLRASTPTDAAKRIVPDWSAENALLEEARARTIAALINRVRREHEALTELVTRSRRNLAHRLTAARQDITHLLAQVRALSPLATLERGYAVVVLVDDDHKAVSVVRDETQVAQGDRLRIRVARGSFSAVRDE
jgi:exodeoxyribonuclease VII large subunit